MWVEHRQPSHPQRKGRAAMGHRARQPAVYILQFEYILHFTPRSRLYPRDQGHESSNARTWFDIGVWAGDDVGRLSAFP